MSEFFKNRLDMAHAMIDEKGYDEAVEIIQNLKIRIHDTDLLTQINMHDTETEKIYENDYYALSSKGGDPYDSFVKVTQLKKRRSQEYLKYYDKIIREHDL